MGFVMGRPNEVDCLYKYYPLRKDNKDDDAHIEQVILLNEIYFGSLDKFNDPFECAPIYVAPHEGYEEWINRMREANKYPASLIDRIEKRMKDGEVSLPELSREMMEEMPSLISKKAGICCFSAEKDILLMWAHYASSHTGVCFKFKADSYTPFFGEAQEVEYSKYRPSANLFNEDLSANAVATFLTKDDTWSYEKEYRLVGYNRKPGIYKYPEDLLEGIILGARIDPSHADLIKNMVKKSQKSINLFRARLSDAKFRIDIFPEDV